MKDERTYKRIENQEWDISVDERGVPLSFDGAILSVLQDIRRELKQLNALFKDQPFVYYPKGDGK